MSVFISYNRQDEAFVDRLSQALIAAEVPVWRDVWQLGLGDSITQSIQDALGKASFVCIVLSENALQSRWVEREITASLVRELDQDTVFILPLLIDDCTLPLFLRDKLYADFRTDFDAGLRQVLSAVADKYNLHAGRFTNTGKATSFGTDVVVFEHGVEINIDVISEDDDAPYYILSKIRLSGNDVAREQFKLYQDEGRGGDFVRELMSSLQGHPDIGAARVVIGGNRPARQRFDVNSGEGGLAFAIDVTCKKVGPDDGRYVAFPLGRLFQFHAEQHGS